MEASRLHDANPGRCGDAGKQGQNRPETSAGGATFRFSNKGFQLLRNLVSTSAGQVQSLMSKVHFG